MMRAADVDAERLFAGGGAVRAMMRSIDWACTALGPVGGWSPSLRTTVKLLLVNRFPLLLCWGPHHCQLYNDAYRPVLGEKHPRSMGQPARECWPEIWDVIGPLIRTPYEGGEATWNADLFLELDRHGFVEETHFTIAYSPVPDESTPTGIGGVLATVHEITRQLVEERRVAALRDLGARAGEARTVEGACRIAADAFARHVRDVPFALLYLVDAARGTARLAGVAGVEQTPAAAPLLVDLSRADDPRGWPLASVYRGGQPELVERIARWCHPIPRGPWSDPPEQALVLPIRSSVAARPAGLLVLGISPRLTFDDLYRSFFELAAGQVATAIAHARAYEEEHHRAEALAELARARREGETRLRDREERLRRLLDAAPVAIFFAADPECRVVTANRRAAELLGAPADANYSAEEPAAFPARCTARRDGREIPVRELPLQVAIRTRAPIDGDEIEVAFADGRTLRLLFNAAPLLDEAGRVTGAVAVGVDINARLRDMAALKAAAEEREHLLAAAERARAEAERANQAKDDFLAVLSHELRAPLQAMVGWIALLRRDALEGAERIRALDSVQRSIRVQSQLVNDLLEISRIASGKLRLEEVPLDLGAITQATVEQLSPLVRDHGIRFSWDIGSCAPVIGDPERLAQVVTNLLGNAMKFTPAGGSIEVTCRQQGGEAWLVVRDSGEGIAPDDLGRIFDPFQQLESPRTRAHGGLGLGLSIVRHIVERHRGTVAAESEGRGHGATFTVRLPLSVDACRARSPEQSAVATMPPPEALAGTRVLVVEDDEDARESLALVLESFGGRVAVAASAGEAFQALTGGTAFDVIVTDLAMPGEDGYSFVRRIRDAGVTLPVIALTGFVATEDRERVLASSFQGHVPKPVDADVLVGIMSRLVRARASAAP